MQHRYYKWNSKVLLGLEYKSSNNIKLNQKFSYTLNIGLSKHAYGWSPIHHQLLSKWIIKINQKHDTSLLAPGRLMKMGVCVCVQMLSTSESCINLIVVSNDNRPPLPTDFARINSARVSLDRPMWYEPSEHGPNPLQTNFLFHYILCCIYDLAKPIEVNPHLWQHKVYRHDRRPRCRSVQDVSFGGVKSQSQKEHVPLINDSRRTPKHLLSCLSGARGTRIPYTNTHTYISKHIGAIKHDTYTTCVCVCSNVCCSWCFGAALRHPLARSNYLLHKYPKYCIFPPAQYAGGCVKSINILVFSTLTTNDSFSYR